MSTALGVPPKLRIVWGENIRDARERAGESQGDLAARLKCSRQAVSNWERGASAPSFPMQVALADAFGRARSRLFPAA